MMKRILLLFMASLAGGPAARAGLLEEWTVKREPVYAFVRKPQVTRAGDQVTISFESKGLCDATVVVEDPKGVIVRHLASGVLGPNAPEPFRKNAREQTLIWDGKDDSGAYIDDKASHTIRVSLGLNPRFERTLYWHPKRRCGTGRMPVPVPQPEGVYVYDADGVEQVRLYDRDGHYVRTVYPFAASKIQDVKGLGWVTLPDGTRAPEKIGYWLSTYLMGGLARTDAGDGDSARSMAVHDGRIAVAAERVSRFAADGGSGGVDLYGPDVTAEAETRTHLQSEGFQPKSCAFSPDGQWLYLTGYYENVQHALSGHYQATICWNHGVYRMKYASREKPELWLGKPQRGRDADRFDKPTSLCADRAGNVYVADNFNDRVQVFSPDGKLLKSIPVNGPAIVQIHHETQDLYVFSWTMQGLEHQPKRIPAMLRVFGALEDPRLKMETPLPLQGYNETLNKGGRGDEVCWRAALDSWSEPPRIWMCTGGGWGASMEIWDLAGNKLVRKELWNSEVTKAVIRPKSAALARQRLYVDPVKGTRYVGEGDCCISKCFTWLI